LTCNLGFRASFGPDIIDCIFACSQRPLDHGKSCNLERSSSAWMIALTEMAAYSSSGINACLVYTIVGSSVVISGVGIDSDASTFAMRISQILEFEG
jgi:hypothetical protein